MFLIKRHYLHVVVYDQDNIQENKQTYGQWVNNG